MDAIPTDAYLHTRIKTCILMNVVVPALQYIGEVWEGDAEFVKHPEECR